MLRSRDLSIAFAYLAICLLVVDITKSDEEADMDDDEDLDSRAVHVRGDPRQIRHTESSIKDMAAFGVRYINANSDKRYKIVLVSVVQAVISGEKVYIRVLLGETDCSKYETRHKCNVVGLPRVCDIVMWDQTYINGGVTDTSCTKSLLPTLTNQQPSFSPLPPFVLL